MSNILILTSRSRTEALKKSCYIYLVLGPEVKRIWVRSRSCGCLVTWFCYQLIAKPGNKTATVSWPDPIWTRNDLFLSSIFFCKLHFIIKQKNLSMESHSMAALIQVLFGKWFLQPSHYLDPWWQRPWCPVALPGQVKWVDNFILHLHVP